jgi:hypothetical protein
MVHYRNLSLCRVLDVLPSAFFGHLAKESLSSAVLLSVTICDILAPGVVIS